MLIVIGIILIIIACSAFSGGSMAVFFGVAGIGFILLGIIKATLSKNSPADKKFIAVLAGIVLVISIIVSACSSDGSSSSGGSSSRCTICNKSATNTFQGSGYCDKHYKDAINWALDNVSDKN